MTDKSKTDKLPGVDVKSGDEPVSSGRRRFTKMGLTAPVILSLSSQPVWGRACSLSAMLSGNLSAHGDTMTCGGCTPGYWGTHSKNWPGGGYFYPGTCKTTLQGQGNCQWNKWRSDGTRFHHVFGGNLFGNYTLMQVLHLSGGDDPFQVGAHTVAAYLNAAHSGLEGIYPMQNPQEVVDHWNANYNSDLQQVKEFFQYMNELGCPLGGY